MRRALANGDRARLSVTLPTEEGDPIRDHFSLGGDGRIPLYEDGTDDTFGTGDWATIDCYEADWLPEATCGD